MQEFLIFFFNRNNIYKIDLQLSLSKLENQLIYWLSTELRFFQEYKGCKMRSVSQGTYTSNWEAKDYISGKLNSDIWNKQEIFQLKFWHIVM